MNETALLKLVREHSIRSAANFTSLRQNFPLDYDLSLLVDDLISRLSYMRYHLSRLIDMKGADHE